jgi:hypothetical protein
LEVRLQIDADMLNVLKGFETIEVCETWEFHSFIQ